MTIFRMRVVEGVAVADPLGHVTGCFVWYCAPGSHVVYGGAYGFRRQRRDTIGS